MGITTTQYDISIAPVPNDLREVRYSSFYDALYDLHENAGIKFWPLSATNPLPLPFSWISTNPDTNTLADAFTIGPISGKVFTQPGLNNSNPVKRLAATTLVTEQSFGSTGSQSSNDGDTIAVSLTINVAVAEGIEYLGLPSVFTTRFYIVRGNDLAPIAWTNNAPSPTLVDFYGMPADFITGLARWFMHDDNGTTSNIVWYISYVPTVDITVGENVTFTKKFELLDTGLDAFFGETGITASRVRFHPDFESNICIVTGRVGNDLAVVALNMVDWTTVLWRKRLIACEDGTTNAAGMHAPHTTRGRFLALGSPSSVIATKTAYLIDTSTGQTLDSGSLSDPPSQASVGGIYWSAATAQFLFATGPGPDALGSARFDFNLSTSGGGVGYGQLNSFALPSVEGFRSVRLERSNTTGVVNDFFESLQTNLKGYQDASQATLAQKHYDLNGRKVINLESAAALDDLLPLAQAQALV